jgi:hypothetical protein
VLWLDIGWEFQASGNPEPKSSEVHALLCALTPNLADERD